MREQGFIKKVLLDILDYLRYQVEEDKCTVGEMKSICHLVMRELDARGTAKDFADFFGQSEGNVKNVISRRNIPSDKKPKRRVMYHFGWFAEQVPNSWIEKK